MKYIVLFIIFCSLAATGLSKPIHDEHPKGVLDPVHVIVLNLAKETLVTVQESLNASGRVEESSHLKNFIEETERLLSKGQEGSIETAFDLNDHLVAIYNVLEQYRELLPFENTLAVLPTNDDLAEQARLELTDIIAVLVEKKLNMKAKLLMFYDKLLKMLLFKKSMFMIKKQVFNQLLTVILDAVRQVIGQVQSAISPATSVGNNGVKPPASIDESDINLPASIIDNDLNLVVSPNSNADSARDLLNGLIIMNLGKIENGLRKDQKFVEADRIRLYQNIIWTVSANTHAGNSDRPSVTHALERGIELIKEYEQYLTSQTRLLMSAILLGNDTMFEILDKDNYLREADQVQDDNQVTEADQVLDENQLFRVDQMPEIDKDNLPNEKESEENLTILESIRKRLIDLRDELRSRRRTSRVRVAEMYIRVVDFLIARLKANQLDNTIFNDFLSRVRNFLERYAEKNRD